jgi:hypothetical protein
VGRLAGGCEREKRKNNKDVILSYNNIEDENQ